MAKKSITQERLKEVLHYNPDTGAFTWIKSLNPRAPVGLICKTLNGHGYIQIRIDNKVYEIHRLVWIYVHGKWPDHEIDHINGVKTDNRLSNLRDVTRKENGRNARIPSHNTSGIAGVHWCNQQNHWKARIKVNQKIIYLLGTKDFFEACCRRKSAEIKYGFHSNHGRQATP